MNTQRGWELLNIKVLIQKVKRRALRLKNLYVANVMVLENASLVRGRAPLSMIAAVVKKVKVLIAAHLGQ